MPPDQLVSGYYVNELLLKLFARHDGHADVLSSIRRDDRVAEGSADPVRALRIFEKRLLDAFGYGLVLDTDAVDARSRRSAIAMYHYRLEQGAVRALDVAEGSLVFCGQLVAVAGARGTCRPRGSARCTPIAACGTRSCLRGRELKSRAGDAGAAAQPIQLRP